MKRKCTIGSVLIVLMVCSAYSQKFEIDTIQYNGNIEDYLNIVVLGDGYQSSELNQFSSDAVKIKNALFEEVPFANYQNYFNVFAIRVPSNESGASHPGTANDVSEPAHPINDIDNFFGSTFDGFGIHRLLVTQNITAVFNVLISNFPQYDQVVILVNSPYYGGSGGVFATTSLNSSANEIAIHEIGHSFAGLIDEYYAGDQYANEGINMTAETNPSKVKWKNWLEFMQVGIYAHGLTGNSSKWYRPHENCKMRFLGAPFCPVCIEGTIEVIHNFVPNVKSFFPVGSSVIPSELPLTFSADITKPLPNTLDVKWILNGEVKSEGKDSMELALGELKDGANELMLTVKDVSPLLRVDDHDGIHFELVVWEIDNSVTGIEEIRTYKDKVEIDVYPNPSRDFINVRSKTDLGRVVFVELYDELGNLLKSTEIVKADQRLFDIKNLPPGSYFIRFLLGKHLLGVRKVIKI